MTGKGFRVSLLAVWVVAVSVAIVVWLPGRGMARVAYGRPSGLLVAITPQEVIQSGEAGFPSVMRIVDRPSVSFSGHSVVFSGVVHLGRRAISVWGSGQPRVEGSFLVWRLDRLVAGGVPVSPFWLLTVARLAGVSENGLAIDPWRSEIRINTSAIAGPLHGTVLAGAWIEDGYLFVSTAGG